MSCLTLIQSVCLRVGLDAPTAAISSTDRNVKQIVEIANEAGQECARRYPWQALLNVASFTTVATQIQTTLATVSTGLDYIVNDTIWNRTLRRPVFGPKTPQAWEQQQAFAINGPWSNYRIQNDTIYFYPVPAAGQDCYFEWISKNWVTTSGGSTSATWTNDADTPKLDNNLLVLDTIWRWKAAKKLDYAEDFNKAERLCMDLMARDGGKDILNAGDAHYDILPGVVVPAGSWGT